MFFTRKPDFRAFYSLGRLAALLSWLSLSLLAPKPFAANKIHRQEPIFSHTPTGSKYKQLLFNNLREVAGEAFSFRILSQQPDETNCGTEDVFR